MTDLKLAAQKASLSLIERALLHVPIGDDNAEELTAAIEAVRSLCAAPQHQEEREPVAVVGTNYTLLWIGGGPIAPIVERHGLRPGSKLYATPPLLQKEEGEPPRFPTMLRKMWSGGEVQEWIDEHWATRQGEKP